ncbi:MAG: hypothetical protein JRJ57_00130 [Deltaproteobacteria bacterium]|nr:hypothetical protein [Deltaproteobacteria bacterium]
MVNMKSKIEDEHQKIKMKNSEIGHKLSEPIEALKSGYHENAIFLCVDILQSIMRDMWRKENIPGNPEVLDVEKLLEGVKGKIEDQLIVRYFDEITEASQRADKGEHLEIEDAFEMMRKLCSVVMWYLERYSYRYVKSNLRRRHIGLISLVVLLSVITGTFMINFFVDRLKTTKVIEQPSAQNSFLEPHTYEDWMKFGEMQISYDDLNGAIHSFTKALEIEKTDAAYYSRALYYYLKTFYEKSLSDCNEAIRINPKSGDAYYIKGRIFEKIGKIEKSKESYLKACSLGCFRACEKYEKLVVRKIPAESTPTGQPSIAKKASSETQELFPQITGPINKKTRKQKKLEYVAWINKALRQMKIDNYIGAIHSLSQGLKIKKFYGTYRARAIAYASIDLYEKALDDCNEAIKINPKYGDAYATRGLIFQKLHDVEKAKKDYMKAFSLGHTQACVYYEKITGEKMPVAEKKGK